MFRSLAVKLTLAFLLVGLTGSILVAIIIQQRTRVAFNTFIMNQEQQTLADNLVVYYQTNGSWTGVGNEVVTLQTTMPQPPRGGSDTRQGGAPFTLVSPDRTVVYSNQPNEIGNKLTKNQLTGAINLQSNGQSIGWLVLAPMTRNFNPNTPESNFLHNVNSATLLSAIVAILLAFALGGFLAFTMTRSLRELTEATIEIAKGRFGNLVKVRSKDEIGNLAVSFNQMSSDLERATRARQQMTADIAHDLRSPLSVITGYAEALSDNKLQGTPEVYNILLQETKHLDRLVDDLRLLSLADTGELSLSLQATAPRALLERVAARHIVAAQQSKVSLIVDASDELPLIHVDVERMSQVLDNLILNAFRYTSEGGEIYLDAAKEDRQVKIIVRDNGQGILPEDLPHIFDRFYRGDKSRTNNGESGLGLAIAKSIVEAHGGRINVESTLGEGAAFTIYLDAYIPDLKST